MKDQIEMMSDPHGYLSRKCTEKGISLTELCRRAGADRSVVQRWKVKNTLSFLIMEKLVKELDSIEKPTLKHAGNVPAVNAGCPASNIETEGDHD